MRTSFRVGRIGSTEIRLHLSLVLILPYAFFQFRPETWQEMAWTLSLLVILFGCILLHEIGHTLVARRFGIQVHSILLWPLGGIATLDRVPEKPLAALLIALAGPLVNLVLGVGLLVWSFGLMYGSLVFSSAQVFTGVLRTAAIRFPLSVGISNLILAVFNLIPIYPLDGGQVMRAGLHLMVGRQRADQFTLLIAVPLAAALALFGFWQGDFLLVLISLLLVFGASTLNARLLRNITTGFAAFSNRGTYYQMKGDFDRAVEYFTRAIDRHPEQAAPYISRAVAQINLQQFDLAREDVKRALQEEPENMLAILLRAELYALEGRYDLAVEWCQRARQLRPEVSWSYADLGSIYLKQERLTEALAELDRAIELNPRFYISYVLRSIARHRAGDREGARADQEAATNLSLKEALVFPEFYLPTFGDHLNWALDYYAWALQRLPHSPFPYHGRANALRAHGEWQRAVADYSQAIRLAPGQAELYLGRGRAYQGSGASALAAEDFQRAGQMGRKTHLRRQAGELLQALDARKSGEGEFLG